MDWKNDIIEMHEDGCSDSDIEDYINAHDGINEREVWIFVEELNAPNCCKGCENISFYKDAYPCLVCARLASGNHDFYKAR